MTPLIGLTTQTCGGSHANKGGSSGAFDDCFDSIIRAHQERSRDQVRTRLRRPQPRSCPPSHLPDSGEHCLRWHRPANRFLEPASSCAFVAKSSYFHDGLHPTRFVVVDDVDDDEATIKTTSHIDERAFVDLLCLLAPDNNTDMHTVTHRHHVNTNFTHTSLQTQLTNNSQGFSTAGLWYVMCVMCVLFGGEVVCSCLFSCRLSSS